MQQKILILTAIPHGLRLDREIREIEEAIRRSARRDIFEIKMRTAVRSQDIRRAIAEERPQVVHFCGYGLADGSLLLEDEGGKDKPVPSPGLAKLFELHADYVQCILINACHSATPAQAINQYINYAIGMNQEIKDQAAIAFTQGFYDTLGYDHPNQVEVFPRAFKEALVAIQLENFPQAEIPVFYQKEIINPPLISPPVKMEQELNDHDVETIRELLQLSGRAAPERRKTLCIEIGINPGDLTGILTLAENDFAVELVETLHKRKLNLVFYKLCQKLATDFPGSKYNDKLVEIKIKLNCP